jgi:hypothetical protein
VVPAARLRPRQSPRSETVPQCIDHLNRLAKFRDIKFSAGQIEQLNQIKKFFKFDFLMAATNFNANVTFRGASCLILVHEETWFRWLEEVNPMSHYKLTVELKYYSKGPRS